jgi:hypothetical protein
MQSSVGLKHLFNRGHISAFLGSTDYKRNCPLLQREEYLEPHIHVNLVFSTMNNIKNKKRSQLTEKHMKIYL